MTESITSSQNPRVKQAVKLRDRRGREEQDRILIDGARELLRAVEAGIELKEVFWCPELAVSPEAREALRRCESLPVERLRVTAAVYEKLVFGNRNDGMVAVASRPRWRLDRLALPERPVVAILEGVEKPGNLGAVLRSADGAGLSAVIVADGRTDLLNPNAIRASMGTIFTLPVCEATAEQTLAWLIERGFSIFAARLDGAIDYAAVDYRPPAAVVLGTEATGLSPVWNDPRVTAVKLPMLGRADSLNVSAAAAVFFYETLRARR